MPDESDYPIYSKELRYLRLAGTSDFRREEVSTLHALARRVLQATQRTDPPHAPTLEAIDRAMLSLVEQSIRRHSTGSSQQAILMHFGFMRPSPKLLAAANVSQESLVRHSARAAVARCVAAYSADHYREKILNPTLDAVIRTLSEEPVLDDLAAVTINSPQTRTAFAVTSHKFVPVWIGLDAAEQFACEFDGQSGVIRGVPTTQLALGGLQRSLLFSFGVVVVHVSETLTFETLTALARWRRRTYIEVEDHVHRHLQTVYSRLRPGHSAPRPSHVLSLYYLHHYGWPEVEHRAAVSLLAMPSVLLERPEETPLHHVEGEREDRHLKQGLVARELRDFGMPQVSHAFAGWAGVAYAPIDRSRALPETTLVDLEVLLQAIWCYADVVSVNENVASELSLKTHMALQRALFHADPHESTQLCIAREAMVATSRVTALLEEARESIISGNRSSK